MICLLILLLLMNIGLEGEKSAARTRESYHLSACKKIAVLGKKIVFFKADRAVARIAALGIDTAEQAWKRIYHSVSHFSFLPLRAYRAPRGNRRCRNKARASRG